MLLQFNFKNYESFRDETTLDFSATKITEHSDRVVQIGNEKVLPVAAIFGANASGKSAALSAFSFMTIYVLASWGYGGEDGKKRADPKRPDRLPFAFDKNSKEQPSTFEVYFISSEDDRFKTYNYGFSVDDDGVTEEWLNVKAKSAREFKRVFYRGDGELDLSGLPSRSRENIRTALEKETLVVSLGAKLKVEKLKRIRNWFLDVDFVDFGNPMASVYYSRMITDNFVDSKDEQQKVVNYLAAFDPSIIGFDAKRVKDDDGEERIEINAVHRVIGTEETASIPLDQESDGTQKMFALYPPLQYALNHGGVLCIDELNAKLHPLLVRSFILTFLNPEINKNHAQLIFTTHDAWQLDNDLLRRDEIWFTEKDKNGVSSLYSLADFADEGGNKIRKDESYEKNYLLGKYGAIPSLKSLDVF